MARYVFDAETDGLLNECTRCWIIVMKDLDFGIRHIFYEGDLGWKKLFNEASLLVGHHVLGFDFPMLEKLFGYKLPRGVTVHDTVIMSQVLDYKRFGNKGHSMAVWGESLGVPKVEHEDWSQFSPEMEHRCVTDVDLNIKMYNALLQEFFELAERAPYLKHYLRAEHAVAKWCATAELNGWPINVERAIELFDTMEAELQATYDALNYKLGTKTVAVDKKLGVVATKMPKWTKKGFYDSHTANWFGIDPCSGFEGEERLVVGEYCRVSFEALKLSSVADVKIFLFRNGWEPTEWNYNKETKEKSSPKITEDSLEFLGGDGKLYTDYASTSSRHSILKTWLNNVDDNGYLHGTCMPIGTPSMRATHSIIVNVPSADSSWGKEMRQLFGAPPGWKLIGCDSSGNQARGLAHYLNNQEFIDLLLNGDIHQYNADVLTSVLKSMGYNHVVPRGIAKRILYAFLFGASGQKLWSYVFGIADKKLGNKLKSGFLKAVPGFKELLDKLENIYGKTSQYGDGYIPGIAGNRIYVDSFHKLLVYLLQATEKATCSAAVMLTMERLEEAGIPYQPYIMMHDEEDFAVPEEYAEQAAAIGKQAFIDGPKLFGIQIMDGEAKIGNNWYDCH